MCTVKVSIWSRSAVPLDVEASALYGARLIRLVNSLSEGQTIGKLFMTSRDMTKLIMMMTSLVLENIAAATSSVLVQPHDNHDYLMPWRTIEDDVRNGVNIDGITFDTISTWLVQSYAGHDCLVFWLRHCYEQSWLLRCFITKATRGGNLNSNHFLLFKLAHNFPKTIFLLSFITIVISTTSRIGHCVYTPEPRRLNKQVSNQAPWWQSKPVHASPRTGIPITKMLLLLQFSLRDLFGRRMKTMRLPRSSCALTPLKPTLSSMS